jgi:N-acetylglucosaminyldiphosphoundecaprenol N-acetyl-beta-D-mannosaminyltransferase
VPIDFIDPEVVVGRMLDAALERHFFQVATVNVDFLVNSRDDAEVAQILESTDINVADGAPVAWAGRLLGCAHARRLAGVDLVPILAGEAARRGLRVFFLGGEGGSAEEAARRLQVQYRGLDVVTMEPARASLDEMDDDEILRAIRAADPRVLLVAFGHPKQDKWIYRHRDDLPMAAMGVGCSFDIIAGCHSRAPRWAQVAGLEWGYRLVHEPRRLAPRYATDGLWVTGELMPWVISKRFGLAGGPERDGDQSAAA